MKAQTKGESDWKKKELGKLHKLGILNSAGASGKLGSSSTVSASDAIEERGYPGTAIYMAKAVDIFFVRRAQVLQ
jgi:hypothetical protein